VYCAKTAESSVSGFGCRLLTHVDLTNHVLEHKVQIFLRERGTRVVKLLIFIVDYVCVINTSIICMIL